MVILLSGGLVSNLGLISMDGFSKGYKYKIYRGYDYHELGPLICRRYDDPETWITLASRIENLEDRLRCYAGMKWGLGDEAFNYDYNFYIKEVLSKINTQYWPYACERLGWTIGYDTTIRRDLKENLDKRWHPYFFRGVGMEVGKRMVYDMSHYRNEDEKVEEEYKPYFYQGIGIVLFDALVDKTGRFLRFMNIVEERLKPDVYKGLAQGKEYHRFRYNGFGFGIGSIGYDIEKWNQKIAKIEKVYKPFCYQRLGIEIGWRFIHDIEKYLRFLDQAEEKYQPHLYKGLGIGIGWRFGYDIAGCVAMIKETDQSFWPYIYEGLGMGIAKRYGPEKSEWVGEIKKVPLIYESYFNKGFRIPLELSQSSFEEKP